MHYLHRILVRINYPICDEQLDRTELIEEVRYYAERQTEGFEDTVFDWRETEDAGSWKEMYPQQVYFAQDDLDWFLNELEKVRKYQDSEIGRLITSLATQDIGDLKAIANRVLSAERISDISDICYTFYLLACFLRGKYTADSMFFNTVTSRARLFKQDIQEIKNNPSNWALVFFDYHY